MSNTKFKCLPFLAMAFLGCTDIPDELRDGSSESKCNGYTYDPSNKRCGTGGVIETKCGTGSYYYNPETQFCNGNSVYSKCNGSEYDPATQGCQNYIVQIRCGTGSYYYIPEKQFCIGNSVYDKCNGNTYTPTSQRCGTGGVVETRCGTGSYYYNPETQFCVNNNVYSKCNGNTYTPTSQRCGTGGIVETKCGTGSNYYIPETQFCNGNSVYSKCDGSEYDPATQGCPNNVIKSICGSYYYNPETQFCSSNNVYDKCNGQIYTPTSQRCGTGNVIETKCGTDWYNAANTNLRCESSVVETKCGTDWYNAANANLRCQSSVVETKCGSEWYNSSTQFCYNSSKVVNLCGNNPQKSYDPDLYECRPSINPNGIYLKAGITDNRDNDKTYNAVLIGTQTWMAENLNYDASGSKCGNGSSSLSDANTTICDTYGRLYNWSTAIDACPAGWHLPSDAEWDVLIPLCSVNSSCAGAGTKLKATNGWNGTDEYGFAALPGGYGNSGGNFLNVGGYGFWWSATECSVVCSAYNAYSRDMSYYSENVGRYDDDMSLLFSVRCLQD